GSERIMMSKKHLILLTWIVFISACWDTVNLEDRAFIVGTGLDFAPDAEQGESPPLLSITNQIVAPTNIALAGSSAGAGESGGGKPFVNITTIGKSIYTLDREFYAKINKVPYYEHFHLLILSENLAKTSKLTPQLLDTYIRDPHIRRGTKVVIANNPTEILNYQSGENNIPVRYIDEMLEQNYSYAGFIEPLSLGDIDEFHLRNNSYVLPIIKLHEELQNDSAAVFHGVEEKMVGKLNKEELQGFSFMTKAAKGNIVDFSYKDEMFAFEIIRLNHHLRVDPSNTKQM